ncbi:type II toxin-antitoxin system RelE/ParE family toxin [Alkalibacterium sp. MB6]|uniref:type II toxin-antitoxin system RelE/ParE family toxin n=1 Tax=Alkalibacterium sp. MB6 TaxID=2081965 RepID=UPI00137B2E1A
MKIIQGKCIKKLEKDLYEIRSIQGSDIQRAIYFQIKDDYYYITHGFTKKTQKTPKREINKARNVRASFKNDKK